MPAPFARDLMTRPVLTVRDDRTLYCYDLKNR